MFVRLVEIMYYRQVVFGLNKFCEFLKESEVIISIFLDCRVMFDRSNINDYQYVVIIVMLDVGVKFKLVLYCFIYLRFLLIYCFVGVRESEREKERFILCIWVQLG